MKTQVGVALVIALAASTAAEAQYREARERRRTGLLPEGCNCVQGQTFEKARAAAAGEAAQLELEKYEQDASLSGGAPTSVHMFYRDQPTSIQTYLTQPLNPFPSEVVYMAVQFRPDASDGWVRVEFDALVSVSPPAHRRAGLGYSLYLKEDGGNGTIQFSGEKTCGVGEVCGYLEQTSNAPWLALGDSDDLWASVGRSDFFQATEDRLYEVQVHIFPVHEGPVSGSVVVNNGTLTISSGK